MKKKKFYNREDRYETFNSEINNNFITNDVTPDSSSSIRKTGTRQ